MVLKFEKGKKYAIVGGNGSGKSSIAKIISGINSEYRGNILINDETESALDDETKKYIFDEILQDNKACNIVITHKVDENLAKFDNIIYIFNNKCFVFSTYYEFITWKEFSNYK